MIKRIIIFLKKQYLLKKIKKEWQITVSRHVKLLNVQLCRLANVAHHAEISNSSIGKRSSIGRYTKIQFSEIGNYCSISWDVTIGALEHPINSISTHAFTYRKKFGLCERDIYYPHKKTVIGNDVWIGCGVIIMPGIHVGDGAIVGAGSIVTKDVMPYEIVAGVPAKHLRNRFDDNIIEGLLKSKWWYWNDKVMKDNINLFASNTIIDDEVVQEILEINKNTQIDYEKDKYLKIS